jgi:hypothetical protein
MASNGGLLRSSCAQPRFGTVDTARPDYTANGSPSDRLCTASSSFDGEYAAAALLKGQPLCHMILDVV